MTEAFSTCSLLCAALLLSFYIFASEAQVICQSSGCDGCCVTSEYCSTEHTLVNEANDCTSPPSPETPMIPGLEPCPYDIITLQYKSCPYSRVDDETKSVGDYGKPNWVGAEFQSTAHDSFSMTVMWQHTNADDIELPLLNLSSVQGYEIRIIHKKEGSREVVKSCYCVTDPSMRNVSNIRSRLFEYKEMSHMIVEVRTFPSLIGQDESNRRRNCSLLTGCATASTAEDCFFSRSDCYSWPPNCLNFYDPLTCGPLLYNPPEIIKADPSLVGDIWQLDLSWEPPIMNDLFPIPNLYYVTIESNYSTFNWKVNATDISIFPLNCTTYTVFIAAYVPCSGFSRSDAKTTGNVGCGYQSMMTIEIPPPTSPTTPFIPTTLVPNITAWETWETPSTPTKLNLIVATAAVVALSAAVIIICMLAALMFLWRKCAPKTRSSMPTLYVDIDIGIQPKVNSNVCVFVFYPKATEHEDELFIQTYIVAELNKYTEIIKEIKSCDDPYFERGHIPESIDKSFREADFVLIICNSIFLNEWNSDECSPSVQLLKRYIGNISIRSDDSISKLVTVVLDEQKKQVLPHSRLNLGSLKSFMVTESTWENDIQNIVRYMTGTPLFQFAMQEHSLAVLDSLESPGTPVSDIVPDTSQESHTVTPRTSDSSLSDSKYNHYTQGGEVV